jgi:hypothetical protein
MGRYTCLIRCYGCNCIGVIPLCEIEDCMRMGYACVESCVCSVLTLVIWYCVCSLNVSTRIVQFWKFNVHSSVQG